MVDLTVVQVTLFTVMGCLIVFLVFVLLLVFWRREEVFSKVYTGVPFDKDRAPELSEKALEDALVREEQKVPEKDLRPTVADFGAQRMIDDGFPEVEIVDLPVFDEVPKVRQRKKGRR